MASSPNSLLTRQVRKVRQRLLIQSCINQRIVAWVIACAVVAVWILAKPYAIGITKPWVDWTVGGCVFALATLVAVGLALRKAPLPVDAALSLDQRFNLPRAGDNFADHAARRTALAAGQTPLADAEQKVDGLIVGQKFPVKLGWQSVLVPIAAIALALPIFFYDPVIPQQQTNAVQNPAVPTEVAKVLEQKKQEYLQKQKACAKAGPEAEERRCQKH